MKREKNDSEGSFNLTNYNNNIDSSNYVSETIECK